MKYFKIIVLTTSFLAISSVQLNAQYLGDQFLSFFGLKAGTQPAPGVYVVVPGFYQFRDISINDPQGNRLLSNTNFNVNAWVLPAVEVVTPFKIFGATYGATYTQYILNGQLNVASFNFSRVASYGFGDIYVQPAVLGWHKQHADFTAAYGFWAPTGSGHYGTHMWVNEAAFGTTLYPDHAKKWNVSTMLFYDFNRPKRNTDVQVGQILTLDGGLGRSFLKQNAANIGVAYSGQWKMTHDSGPDIPAILPISNGRALSVGPEIELPIFAKGPYVGLFDFRYQWVVDAKTALGGQVLITSFTFAKLFSQGR
jgi:hypothetical protein